MLACPFINFTVERSCAQAPVPLQKKQDHEGIDCGEHDAHYQQEPSQSHPCLPIPLFRHHPCHDAQRIVGYCSSGFRFGPVDFGSIHAWASRTPTRDESHVCVHQLIPTAPDPAAAARSR